MHNHLQNDYIENFDNGKTFKRVYIGDEIDYTETLNSMIYEAYDSGHKLVQVEDGLHYQVIYRNEDFYDINKKNLLGKKIRVGYLNDFKYTDDFMFNPFINIFDEPAF